MIHAQFRLPFLHQAVAALNSSTSLRTIAKNPSTIAPPSTQCNPLTSIQSLRPLHLHHPPPISPIHHPEHQQPYHPPPFHPPPPRSRTRAPTTMHPHPIRRPNASCSPSPKPYPLPWPAPRPASSSASYPTTSRTIRPKPARTRRP